MKMDFCCVKTLRDKLSGYWCAIDRPVVRKRIDAEVGIFGDRNASKPVASLDIDGEWCYKLSCVLKIMAAIMLVMWLWCRISRWMRKVF